MTEKDQTTDKKRFHINFRIIFYHFKVKQTRTDTRTRSMCPGHVTVKEQLCAQDVELMAVGLRPYYIPREFSRVNKMDAIVTGGRLRWGVLVCFVAECPSKHQARSIYYT